MPLLPKLHRKYESPFGLWREPIDEFWLLQFKIYSLLDAYR